MAVLILDNLELGENQLLNASLQQVSSDPAGFEAQIIYNTTSNTFKYYNGSVWVSLDGSGDISAVIAGNGLTGGGTSGSVTLTVGSGDGITVAASSVGVDSTVVRTTGAQTIGGLKTFSSIPIVGTALTADNSTQAASTAWVNLQGYSTTVGVVTSVSGSSGADVGINITGTAAVPIVNATLNTTAVIAGSYTYSSITVDAQGRLTSASSGAAPGTMNSFRMQGDTGTIESITDNQILSIVGGTGVDTISSSADTLTIALNLDELPTVTLYNGSTEYIPMVTAANVSSKILGNNISLSQLGAPTASLDIGSNKLINVLTPTLAQDAANKAYVDASVSGSGALIYQGGYDAATNTPNLDATPVITINKGFTYTVTVAGLFFTEQVEVGDLIIAEINTPTVLTDWTTVQNNVDIASSTTVGIASFPVAGGLSITSLGAVSMPDLGTASAVGSASQSLTITTDAKGRISAKSAQTIAITASQVTDFCTAVSSCVATDTAYAANIGDGAATSIAVTHGLGTADVAVELYNIASGQTVYATVVRTSINVVTISTSVAIALNAVRVLVKKIG